MATQQDKAHTANRPPKDVDQIDDTADTPGAEHQERVKQLGLDVDELLDDMDAAMRASLDLKPDDSDKLFNERAETAVKNYQQKGGQ